MTEETKQYDAPAANFFEWFDSAEPEKNGKTILALEYYEPYEGEETGAAYALDEHNKLVMHGFSIAPARFKDFLADHALVRLSDSERTVFINPAAIEGKKSHVFIRHLPNGEVEYAVCFVFKNRDDFSLMLIGNPDDMVKELGIAISGDPVSLHAQIAGFTADESGKSQRLLLN